MINKILDVFKIKKPKSSPISENSDILPENQEMSLPPQPEISAAPILPTVSEEKPVELEKIPEVNEEKPSLDADSLEKPQPEIAPIPYSTEEKDLTEDPLEPETPDFNIDAPTPDDQPTMHTTAPTVFNFPENIKTDTERIEYILELLNNKLSNHEYTELNSSYRRLYEIYQNSETLSVNERFLLGEKIQEMFDRIKHILTIGPVQ